MIAVTPVTDPKSYVIDPLVDALSTTIWAVQSGTPTVTGGRYNLNSASMRTVPQFLYGEVDMKIIVPSLPTDNQARQFGYMGVSSGLRGAMVFRIIGTNFYVEVFNNDGISIHQEPIPWNSVWTCNETSFIISHLDTNVTFIVRSAAGAADEYKVSFSLAERTMLETKIVEISKYLVIDNYVSDDLEVSFVAFNNLQRVTSAEHFAGLVPSDGTGIPVHIENVDPIPTTSATYTLYLDEVSSTITYVGEAVPGTATSASTWRIKRLDSTSGLVVAWANGDSAFDKIWDNRASYTYS